jgi:hypothetical protein
LNEFKRLYNFYFRISAFYFGKQSMSQRDALGYRVAAPLVREGMIN